MAKICGRAVMYQIMQWNFCTPYPPQSLDLQAQRPTQKGGIKNSASIRSGHIFPDLATPIYDLDCMTSKFGECNFILLNPRVKKAS